MKIYPANNHKFCVPDRCSYLKVMLDISGSMCVGYSTLGKKTEGKLQMETPCHNKLMLLWLIYHGRARTPLLLHENVKTFNSSYLVDKAKHFGYEHVGTIQTVGSDAGLAVNARTRLCFDSKHGQIEDMFVVWHGQWE